MENKKNLKDNIINLSLGDTVCIRRVEWDESETEKNVLNKRFIYDRGTLIYASVNELIRGVTNYSIVLYKHLEFPQFIFQCLCEDLSKPVGDDNIEGDSTAEIFRNTVFCKDTFDVSISKLKANNYSLIELFAMKKDNYISIKNVDNIVHIKTVLVEKTHGLKNGKKIIMRAEMGTMLLDMFERTQSLKKQENE